jgi:chromosome segregation ATPase
MRVPVWAAVLGVVAAFFAGNARSTSAGRTDSVATLTRKVNALTKQVSTLTRSVNGLYVETGNLDQSVSNLRDEGAQLKQSVSSVSSDTSQLKQQQAKLQSTQSATTYWAQKVCPSGGRLVSGFFTSPSGLVPVYVTCPPAP